MRQSKSNTYGGTLMIHAIKSAIILAAGRGKRLNVLTDARPKSLITVRDKPLLERLIEQLLAKQIDDIYVVTGYKHQMFEYLIEKYNVKLVYNKKWFCTNNIVSFIKAFEERSQLSNLQNTIMLDSDLYIEDESILRTEIDKSGYYLEYSNDVSECSKEWVVNIRDTKDCKIYDVVTNGSCDCGYILRSLSFWTADDMRKLYTLAKNATSSGKNMQRYIDDIPCVLYKNEFDLKGYISEKHSMFEIDTILDYNKVNKE